MLELIQFPFSPFCIPQRRLLEYSGAKFKIINVPAQERALVWKLTKQKYYGVPVIRDGRNIIFDDTDDQQLVARYLDRKLKLGLFPAEHEGVQAILWRYIENEIEGAAFRLNDIFYRENTPADQQLQYLRFKERKFGRGCIDQWRAQKHDWLKKWKPRSSRLNKCWRTRNSCWTNARGSWISTCSGCWKISFSPVITRRRNPSRICAPGIAA